MWMRIMKVGEQFCVWEGSAMLYNSDAAKIMTTLNKMSSRRGASYAKIWYNKMADTLITNSKKTFDKFTQNFESTV